MSYSQIYGNAETQSKNSMGIPGGSFTTMHFADPDIAAQGEQQRKTQGMALDWQKQKFNTLLPMLQGAMGGAGGGFGMQGVGTAVPMPQMGGPHIQGGPLYTQQGINQNVNANAAMVDRSIATQNANQAGQMAGHGFGTSGPAAAALQNQNFMAGLGQKQDYERQFRDQARQGNAQFGLQAANAQQGQFAANQNAMLGYGQNLLGDARNRITAQGQAMQYQSNLLNQLSNLM